MQHEIRRIEMQHEIKVDVRWSDGIISGRKAIEVRKNDGNFRAGDSLVFRLVNNGEYFDQYGYLFEIMYVLDDKTEGIATGYCCLRIRYLYDFVVAQNKKD